MFTADQLHIGKLLASANEAEFSVARTAVSSFIQHADLHPKGLPSSVILVIRQFSDPLPGRVPSQIHGRLRHAQWEAAVRDQISACYRAAQRPVKGIINDDADAVSFADHGELIACLSLDICSNKVGDRWWWRQVIQQLVRQNVDTNKLAGIWRQSISTLPATISYLLQWGGAGAVISSLDNSDADALTGSLAQVHSLDLLRRKLANSHAALQRYFLAPLLDQETLQQSSEEQFEHEPEDAGYCRLTSLWEEQLSATSMPGNLSVEQLRLLLLGAALHRSPWRVKHRQWQRELVFANVDSGDRTAREDSAWQSTGRDERSSDANSLSATHSEGAPQRAAHLRLVQNHTVTSNDAPSPGRAHRQDEFDGDDSSQPSKESANISRPKSHSEQLAKNTRPQQNIENSITASTDDNVDRETDNGDRVNASPPEAIVVQQSIGESSLAEVTANLDDAPYLTDDIYRVDASPLGAISVQQSIAEKSLGEITTDLGGAFYLFNLCAWLDIPDCFVNSWPDAAPPSAWSVVEALTLALLGDAKGDYADDALWALLAELDGREAGKPLGFDMVFPERFSLPPEWLNILKQTLKPKHLCSRYSTSEGRLLLWCDDLLLAYEPLQADIKANVQAQDLLGRCAPIKTAKPRHCPLLASLDLKSALAMTAFATTGFAEWFHRLLPFMQFVLMRQCGFDDSDDLAGLLRCRGRVQLTRTHLDFHAPMEAISLPVRAAGLDQDPGWCPLVGRVVQFHFH